MSDFIGTGAFRYRVETNWGELPVPLGDVAAIAAGPEDEVYLFNRGPHPMIVLDRHGAFVRSWGDRLFKNPHGLHIGSDGSLYCTDDGDHTVRKCTPDGRVLLTLGVPGQPAPRMSGFPFCRCTHTALSPSGEIYVADGYFNARVHKYAADGRLLASWGASGTEPGSFNIVHNICCDSEGIVYVADRENHRVQLFDGSGNYIAQWNNLHRPCAMCLGRETDPLCYIGELGPLTALNRSHPNLGPRISVLTRSGVLVARIGDNGFGQRPDQFIAPHGIALDSRGDIYLGEVSNAVWKATVQPELPSEKLRVLRKLVRAPEAAATN